MYVENKQSQQQQQNQKKCVLSLGVVYILRRWLYIYVANDGIDRG